MKPRRLRDNNTALLERQDVPARQQQPGAGDAPLGSERRGRHRVADDQQSGAGSQSALSKLMMLERKRAALLPAKD
jgi:hypothetical protein